MTHQKRGLVAGILFLAIALTPVAAVSGPLEDARDAFNSGDYATALGLFQPLAEQGDADAQFTLGVMYNAGRGIPQDYVEAAKWLRLAAEQGNAIAQGTFGAMYANGRGVPQDHAEAARWYRLAAEQNFAHAQILLGQIYYLGQGATQDYVQAHMWFNLAAVRGNDTAAELRDSVAAEMTPTQITEAQKLAREWRPKGIQGD